MKKLIVWDYATVEYFPEEETFGTAAYSEGSRNESDSSRSDRYLEATKEGGLLSVLSFMGNDWWELCGEVASSRGVGWIYLVFKRPRAESLPINEEIPSGIMEPEA